MPLYFPLSTANKKKSPHPSPPLPPSLPPYHQELLHTDAAGHAVVFALEHRGEEENPALVKEDTDLKKGGREGGREGRREGGREGGLVTFDRSREEEGSAFVKEDTGL